MESLIINKMKTYSDLVWLKPASKNMIDRAEAQLKLKFAPEYRDYVGQFGSVAVNGHELTGVVPSLRLNVVKVTKEEWEFNSKVPNTMYVIENAGIDSIMIWQDASGSIYLSEPDEAPLKIASSLVEYLDT